ncbi:DNA alkylation repair protein [Listeria grandensis]|uniref:DNA alkylation repair protein n=1 Tax=Listeria grandensis TaxID=1494963 RepID=UPI0016279336|nr:DNA alkylation repair protein [Listeria grandensis]MBC1474734.1 DNA alkylation repair protein [Listeria grandensis]
MDNYAEQLIVFLKGKADLEEKQAMEQYMRNQFVFLGLRSSVRREVYREFFAEHGKVQDSVGVARILYEQPEREFRYIALDILTKDVKKQPREVIDFYEQLVVADSWWDTVDLLASTLVGGHFEKYPELIPEYIAKWINGENIWLARTAILFQLKYKENTDAGLLFTNCEKWLDSKEFFIQKAIGWALRQYAKFNADAVLEFVEAYDLAPLSRREALKHFKKKERSE